MGWSDTTARTPPSESSKSPPATPSGRADTSPPAPDRKTTTTRSTAWRNGTTNSRHTSPRTALPMKTKLRMRDIKHLRFLTDMFVVFAQSSFTIKPLKKKKKKKKKKS